MTGTTEKVLYLLRGVLADGQPYYAYMAVETSRLAALQEAEIQGNFIPGDYGEVLVGETGTQTPNPEVAAKIREIFGDSTA